MPTGDIRESYEVMNVVAAHIGTILIEPDFVQASRDAIDNLARAALRLGANGVIWIRIIPVMQQGVYATGTAVRVSATAPRE